MAKGKSNFAIVPRDKKDVEFKPIKSKRDMPDHAIDWRQIYTKLENQYAFSRIRKDRDSKTIKGTMRVAANVDIEDALGDISQDLWDDFRISFKKKKLQEDDTIEDQLWMGLPLDVGTAQVKKDSDEILKPLWRDMGRSMDNFPRYDVVIDWPKNMPWNPRKPGETYEDNGRKTFVYTVARDDMPAFDRLLAKAKDRNLWAELYGEKAFTLKTPPPEEEDEDVEVSSRRQEYQKLVIQNGSLNLSRGCTVLRGCLDYKTKFRLRRRDAEGNEIEPVMKSVRDILEGMEYGGEKPWLMVTRVKGGHVGAFFSNVVDALEARVKAMSQDPAVQIYWKCYKRGVFVEDIYAMLNLCFDTYEVLKIDSSRYSKTQKMAVVDKTAGNMVDMEAMFEESRLIDFTKGLTPNEKREREVAKGIRYGQVRRGSAAAFNFNSSNSAKTATKGRKPSVGPKVVEEGNSMARSVFSPDPQTTVKEAVVEDGNSFDDESIESTESLLQTEAIQREGQAKKTDTTAKGVSEEESPMPKTNLFGDYDPVEMQQRIQKEAAEVKNMGGGEFLGTEDLSEANAANGDGKEEGPAHDEEGNAEMDEIDPDEVENIAQKTDDMKLTEDQTQTLSYQEQFDENFNQTIPDPTKIWEFLWNDLGPSTLNVVEGCGLIASLVHDSEAINEAGFIRDDLSLQKVVSETTERHLFAKLGKNPKKYKTVMTNLMEYFMEQLTKDEEMECALVFLERASNLKHDAVKECSPDKTQEHDLSSRNADEGSDISPKSETAAKKGPSSGQGPP